MSTSGINRFRTFRAYVIMTIFCFLFGWIYDYYSFGVHSASMLYMYSYPLVGGVLVYGTLNVFKKIPWPDRVSYNLYNDGIITLTVGSAVHGVIEIYGTTSKYTKVFTIAGWILLAAGILLYLWKRMNQIKSKRKELDG